MAKRYISTNNSRGNKVTAANPSFAHIRGWDVGVEIIANDAGTEFSVYLTGGSSGADKSKFLGTAYLNSDNAPEWLPPLMPENDIPAHELRILDYLDKNGDRQSARGDEVHSVLDNGVLLSGPLSKARYMILIPWDRVLSLCIRRDDMNVRRRLDPTIPPFPM